MHKATILVMLWSLCSSGSGRISAMRFSCPRFLLCCLWLFAGLLLAGSPVQAETKAGDILVVDQGGGTSGSGALFLVNPKTGSRTVLSDFGNSAQGSLGVALVGVAVGAAERIFVADLFAGEPPFAGGALFEVDPGTGNRTLLSNFSQGIIHGNLYYGLAVDAKGRVIADLQTTDPPLYELDAAVVRVGPDTDERTIVTDLSNPAQGGPDEGINRTIISDLAIEHSGKILISTLRTDFSSPAIFRVQPESGKRQLLSDFTNAKQGVLANLVGSPGAMAVETSGQILVNAFGTTGFVGGLILRIDPKTGQRIVLSDLNDAAQGTLCQLPGGLAVESSGNIIVGATKNPATTTQSLFRVNPKNGQRVLLSDSDNSAQGPPFRVVTYIAVVPQDSDAEGGDTRQRQSGLND